MKVLMIDDDPLAVDQVDMLFTLRWPEVDLISASEGKPGCQMAEIVKPDLIILDMGLPDMDGLEVLRQIRMSSQVPVLVLTMKSQINIETRARDLGADDYIVKPFAPDDFLSRLKALVRST